MQGTGAHLADACRYQVKHVSGGGQRSPPRGGLDPKSANQQLLVSDDDDDLAPSAAAGAAANELAKEEEKRKKRRKVLILLMPYVQEALVTNFCGALSGQYPVHVYLSWACLILEGSAFQKMIICMQVIA